MRMRDEREVALLFLGQSDIQSVNLISRLRKGCLLTYSVLALDNTVYY